MLFLPTSEIEVLLPGLVLLGGFVGVLTGLFGVGGGFLLTPSLKSLFGVPYPIAVGSDLVQIFLTSTVSTYQHLRAGNVDLRLGLILSMGAVAGVEVGVHSLGALRSIGPVAVNGIRTSFLDLVMSGLFLFLLLSVAIIIWREVKFADGATAETDTRVGRLLRRIRLGPQISFSHSDSDSITVWVPLTIGFGVGILTGLMGIGGGILNFPLLIYAIGLPTRIAIGTSSLQVVVASGYGAVRHLMAGNVDLVLVLILFVGSVVGVQIGVKFSQRFQGLRIRRLFVGVLFLGIALIIWDMSKQVFSG